jgi:hypothetical protein
MPRAAGSSHVYEYKLKGRDVGPKLPSVTHIIKYLKDELGFGAMSWWGYKIGIVATLMDQGLRTFEALDDPEVEAYYETAKLTNWTPNTVRDEAGESGTAAHELLEHAALGQVQVIDQEEGVWAFGVPEILASIRYPQEKKAPQRKQWIEDRRDKMRCRGKGLAAARWWLDNEDKHVLVYPEQPVFSVRYGFAGTLDFARDISGSPQELPLVEIIDYKSHKPAAGIHKDGTYADGKGPAYLDDLMQVQAYGQAFDEMGLGIPQEYRIVLLQPDGTYYEDTRTVDFQLFLDFKTIHDRMCPKPECQLLARAYNGGR